jgi:hypothetical protein
MSKYQSTIDIVKNILIDAPTAFSAPRLAEINAKIASLEKDGSLTREQVEDQLIVIGEDVLPYIEAYKSFYKIYGEAVEHRRLQEKLSKPAAEAYLKFIAEGNSVEDVRGAKKFDEFFNPDFRAEIVAAELEAHDGVREEMNRLILGDKKDEFNDILQKEKDKFADINQKIKELVALAGRSEKWTSEILDKARTFKLGLSGIETLPSPVDINKEIEYYIDIMEI